MPSASSNKTLDVVLNVVTTAIFVVALAFTVIVVAMTLTSRGGEVSLFGWKPYVVLSDSMQTEFQVGDIAVSRAVDPNDVQPGDIITFSSIDPNAYGEAVTHKVRELTEYEGELAFVTYGTTTGVDDAYPALASHVTGEFAFAIPKAGYLFRFFKSPAGYVVLVLIPFAILIGLQARNFLRLLNQGRKQQAAVQLDEIEQQRQQIEALQAEIERLRAFGDRAARVPHAAPRPALRSEPGPVPHVAPRPALCPEPRSASCAAPRSAPSRRATNLAYRVPRIDELPIGLATPRQHVSNEPPIGSAERGECAVDEPPIRPAAHGRHALNELPTRPVTQGRHARIRDEVPPQTTKRGKHARSELQTEPVKRGRHAR